MTTTLRVTVRRRSVPQPIDFKHPWLVTPKLNGHTLYDSRVTAASHPEAMQAAWKVLADLDAQLMAEVHASRATRRTKPQTDIHTMEATA